MVRFQRFETESIRQNEFSRNEILFYIYLILFLVDKMGLGLLPTRTLGTIERNREEEIVTIDKRTLGDELAKLRAQAGLSQSSAAAELGLSDKAVSKWETGATCPPLETLSAVAQLYGTTASELIARVESTKRPFTCIALTGGPCAGKSAALAYLRSALSDRGWRVFTVSETATELMEADVSAATCASQEAFQSCVLETQIAKENACSRAALATGGERCVVICDRGGADNAAYLTAIEFEHILTEQGLTLDDVYARYDAVLFLDSAACADDALYTTENNATRLENAAAARESNENTLRAWAGHPHLVRIGAKSSFTEKMRDVVNAALGFLDSGTLAESSHTLLIRKPDLKPIVESPRCITSQHVITYIEAADGACTYIEKREIDDAVLYTKNVVCEGEAAPLATALTASTYRMLAEHADPNFAPLEFTRFTLCEGAITYRINLYSFFPYQAILEVGGPAGTSPKMPAFIQSIRDVSENEVYTSRAFARALAQGRL